MKYCLLLLITFDIHAATQPEGCGSFDIYGRLEKSRTPGEYQYVVHKGTVSEHRFNISDTDEIKLIPYLERSSKVRALLTKEVRDFRGEFAEIIKVEDTIPDPAQMTKNHGFFLVKKEKCQ